MERKWSSFRLKQSPFIRDSNSTNSLRRPKQSTIMRIFANSLKPNNSTDFLKALTDEKIDSLLEKMMNDTDVKEAGREQIRKMPRLQKEMMLLPWMAKSGGSHSTSDAHKAKAHLKQWRHWEPAVRKKEFQAWDLNHLPNPSTTNPAIKLAPEPSFKFKSFNPLLQL